VREEGGGGGLSKACSSVLRSQVVDRGAVGFRRKEGATRELDDEGQAGSRCSGTP
jgi:hypothetical protein